MVDSVQVFDPGFRVTDANGDPVNNAKIKFREIGPGATKEVFSDATLSTSLGHTVRTRSDGFPVVSEGSNTTVMIYTDADAYYIEITDADDVAIFPAKDNVRGALDTSTFLTTGSTSTLDIPVLAKAINYTVLEADRGKLIAADATGGFITMTLPSAITVGDGWNIEISNVGTANQVGIAASQNIGTPLGNVTAFALRPGESCWLKSNGATFEATAFSSPFIMGTTGIIRIADRLSTPPGSPTAGARYIVGSSPTGAWSSFSEHDIAESNGQSGWLRITPASDCGWIAYVEDENAFYAFKGTSWVGLGFTVLQIFTGSGTYTPTPGMSHCLAISTGGGGGGGGADSSDGTSLGGGGGGGAGATAIELFSAATIGTSQTVTIGAAGAAGSDAGGNGGNGGDTTFGALHTAAGGSGGTGSAVTATLTTSPGGAGGAASNGALNVTGGAGEPGFGHDTRSRGGTGGASFWGGGGVGPILVANGSTAGAAAAAYGAGGSGSANVNTTTGTAGGAGAGGVVVVIEFF